MLRLEDLADLAAAHGDALKATAPEPWETLMNVFGSAAEYWQNEETPFWVFIDMRADGLAYLPTVA